MVQLTGVLECNQPGICKFTTFVILFTVRVVLPAECLTLLRLFDNKDIILLAAIAA